MVAVPWQRVTTPMPTSCADVGGLAAAAACAAARDANLNDRPASPLAACACRVAHPTCADFTPWNGIDEDPVNGSSHTNLTPYWSGELGKKTLVSRMCSRRSGRLSLRDDGTHVMIGGDTYLVREGAIHVPTALISSKA